MRIRIKNLVDLDLFISTCFIYKFTKMSIYIKAKDNIIVDLDSSITLPQLEDILSTMNIS